MDIKNKIRKIKKSYFQIAGIALLLLLAALLLLVNNSRSMQAMPSMVGDICFEGEYRIGDGEWRKIVAGSIFRPPRVTLPRGAISIC